MSLASLVLDHGQSSRLAVVGQAQAWTYADLAEHVEQIAGRLRSQGVVAGDLVVVHGSRSPRTVATMVATLLVGAGTVPVDIHAPEARLGHAIRICRPRAIVDTTTGTVRAGSADPAQHARPGHVVFTSGSTGDPKPILVSEPALLNHAEGFLSRLDLTGGDRVLHCTGIDFDVAAEEVWPTLLGGGTVVVLEQPLGTLDFGQLHEVLDRHGVTVCNLPASYFRGWTTALADLPPVPSSVRAVVTGSETVPIDAAARWLRQDAAPRLFNAYGVSEATITSLMHEVGPDSLQGDSLPIGTPLAGVEARVVGPALEELPAGHSGELLLGGRGLAEGYLGAEALTTSFVLLDGERWYRTGDRAVRRGDQFFHEGRLDDQVKIRGHRVEPRQVSAVLTQAPGVEEAVTYVVDDVLVSSYVSTGPVSDEVLKAVLGRRLPAAFVPDLLRHHSRLPRTTGGKVDMAALREQVRRARGNAPVEALDLELVMSVLTHVAPRLKLTPDTGFLRAGGSSMEAARLVAEVNARCGDLLTIDAVYRSRSLRDLVEQAGRGLHGGVAPRDATAHGGGEVRASVSAMLAATHGSGRRHYEWTDVVELEGPVQLDVLARAVDAAVDGHPALRSRFSRVGRSWSRSVVPRAGSTRVVDLALDEVLGQHRARVLDLAREQPFHADVVRLRSGGALLVTSHHAVADGYAATLIAQCVSAQYALLTSQTANTTCRTHGQPPLSLDMCTTEAMREEAVDRHRRTCTAAEWTCRPSAPAAPGRTLRLDVPAHLSSSVARAAQREQVTLTAVLLAALGRAITRSLQRPRVVVGLPVDTRLDEGAADVVGDFTNTAFVGVDQAGEPLDAVGQAHEALLESRRHQLVHHDELRSLSGLNDVFDFRLAVTDGRLGGLRALELGPDVVVRAHQSLAETTTRRRLNLEVTVDELGVPSDYKVLYDVARLDVADLRAIGRAFTRELEVVAHGR